MKTQIPKGLFDILPYGNDQEWQKVDYWAYVEKTARNLATDYGYQEIRTPIFEKAEIFHRSVGETSDIVTKEMYSFPDKANRIMSLRPEGTAPIIRSFIEKNLNQSRSTHKFYYIGPMFRYDRPQAGRYRQHHQFGVEALGINSYEQDVEVIEMLFELYNRLGIKKTSLHINSVGDTKTRLDYRNALQTYLNPFLKELSSESQERFNKNPLRILDSKDPKDKEIVLSAPSILDYLSEQSKTHFIKTLSLLDDLKIKYEINDKLVRGLDYYNDIVFEFVCGDLKSQNSIGGGGRYDSLVSDFGGPKISGVGFGTGLERILQTMQEQKLFPATKPEVFLYFIPLDEESINICFSYTTQIRHANIPADICLKSKKIQKSLQEANKRKANFAIIMGEGERLSQTVQCKNLLTREQTTIPFSSLFDYTQDLWKKFQVNNSMEK
jgi:histidyl-tRNA synthetase